MRTASESQDIESALTKSGSAADIGEGGKVTDEHCDGWHFVENAGSLEDGDMLPARINGTGLLIFRSGNNFFATARRCTHQKADLRLGYFDGEMIECPVHQGRFRVSDGRALGAPVCVDIETYPAKVRDGKVYVEIGKKSTTESDDING